MGPALGHGCRGGRLAEARRVGCASRGGTPAPSPPPLHPPSCSRCRLQGGRHRAGSGGCVAGARAPDCAGRGALAGPHLCSEPPSPAPCAGRPAARTSWRTAAPRPPGTPRGWALAAATRPEGGQRARRGPRRSEPSRTAGQGGLQPQGACVGVGMRVLGMGAPGALGMGCWVWGAGHGGARGTGHGTGFGGTRGTGYGALGLGAPGALGMGAPGELGMGRWAWGSQGGGEQPASGERPTPFRCRVAAGGQGAGGSGLHLTPV